MRTASLYVLSSLHLAIPLTTWGGVLEDVRARVEKSTNPVVVFDLDDTLFDTRYRTQRILKEFAAEPETQKQFPEEARKLSQVTVEQTRYYFADTLRALGIRNETFSKALDPYWVARFFSAEYCTTDRPIDGAVAYVKSLVRKGAQVIYLTGRDRPRMEKCTLQALLMNDFPVTLSDLMMKPAKELDDLAYKEEAFLQIKKLGQVEAAFENEPANANAFLKAFDGAQIVFIDTQHSNKPDVPDASIPWIKHYLLR